MSSVNKVILVGHLGQDPETKVIQSGQMVANFSLATSESWTTDGKKQERTEWHRIVAWGKLAELAEKYLAKGRQVYLEGRIQSRQWDDKDGNKRTTTEIVANQIVFLGGGKGEAESRDPGAATHRERTQPRKGPDPRSGQGQFDEDIPF